MAFTTAQLITQLYVGYYNRAPDPIGLQYWIDRVEAGVSLADIADSFAASPEAISTYPYLALPNVASAENFLTQVYNNLFGRNPDAEGLAYYAGKLASGATTPGQIIAEIQANANSNTTPGNTDAAYLANKVAAGQFWVSKAAEVGNFEYNNAAAASAAAAVSSVTDDPATLAASEIASAAFFEGAGVIGTTFNLTTDIETKVGTANNDVFNGTDKTILLDNLNGAGGVDTLNYDDTTGGKDLNSFGLTLSNVEIVNARSVGASTVTTSGFADVTNVNIKLATDATVNASATQNVTVTGATASITVDGANDVSVVGSSSGANDILIGTNTAVKGNVSVTDLGVGAADVVVGGGKDVTLNLAGSDGQTIVVGQGTAATGVVTIDSANKADGSANETLSDITVTGGTTVDIAQVATSAAAAADTSQQVVTQGAVTINATAGTKSIIVNQTQSTAAVNAVTAVAGVTETASVKFVAAAANQTVIVGGLTFTATVAMTAAEVAQAFAGIINGTVPVAGDTQAGGAAAKGTYSNSISGWTSGAADGDTVVFTSTTANSNAPNIVVGGTAAPTATTTAGSSATDAVTGVLGVVTGAVTINAATEVTTISLNGYGATSINGSAKLESLSLANSGGAVAGATNAAVAVGASAATVALSVNNVKGNVNFAGTEVKTLDVSATGADSTFALTANSAETLNVSGDKAVSFTADLAGLKTVTVSGSAGLTLSGLEANTLTSVDTSATTGKVVSTIDASKATYTGGEGVDVVTLSSTTVSKAISLGGGDDVVNLATGTTALAANIDGGAGVNTLGMAAADAATASATNIFETKISGFTKLSLGSVAAGAAAASVNLDNLDDISYVVYANGGVAVAEQFTATFGFADEVGSDTTIVFDGVTVTYAAGPQTALTVASKFANDYNASLTKSYSAVDNGNGTVTFTSITAGDRTDVVAADFVVTQNTADVLAPSVSAVNVDVDGLNLGALTLTNMLDGGTLELTEAGAGATVSMKDATGTADSFNIVISNDNGIDVGSVAVAGVETLNITASDSDDTAIGTHTIELSDAALKTVVVSGNAALNLNLNANVVALTSVDASALTGALTATTNSTVAQTIIGGSGNDVLTAHTGTLAHTLVGGAGNDTLTGNAGLSTLTGGEGNDLFVINVASQNVNSYTTITDFTADDLIQMTGISGFSNTKVVLGDTAVFQDYANAAINSLNLGQAGWFQFNGNTYIVADMVDEVTPGFVNGQDFVVKLSGLIDLTNASFNSTHDTIGL